MGTGCQGMLLRCSTVELGTGLRKQGEKRRSIASLPGFLVGMACALAGVAVSVEVLNKMKSQG